MTPQHFLASAEQLRGLGQVQPRLLAEATIPTSPSIFIRNIFSEPHSTKQIEDGIDWASDTTGPVLVKTVEARAIPPAFDVSEAMYRKIRCPVLIDPRRQRPDPALCARAGSWREVTGAELVTIRAAATIRSAAIPAKCNDADQRFPRSQARHRRAGDGRPTRARKRQEARSISPRRSVSATAAATSPSRASCASCIPDLQVDWLAQDPVTRLLEASGERVHPAERAAGQRDRGTSSWNRASTICTASRRSAAWTRC